jgi:hypothetical protein
VCRDERPNETCDDKRVGSIDNIKIDVTVIDRRAPRRHICSAGNVGAATRRPHQKVGIGAVSSVHTMRRARPRPHQSNGAAIERQIHIVMAPIGPTMA